jgi:hypothetical protein
MVKNAWAIVWCMPDFKAWWIGRKAVVYCFPDKLGQAVALAQASF